MSIDLNKELQDGPDHEEEVDYYEKYQKEVMAKCKYAHSNKVELQQAKKVVIDCDPGGDDA